MTLNRSLKLTRYGRRRKAGPQPLGHHRVPALRRPAYAGTLARTLERNKEDRC